MFPMLALCAVLSAVTVSEIGDLKDSDRVVTSVTGLSAVTNRIEDRVVPGPDGSLYADRTVKADLSVTDVPYYEYDIPIVSTNYDTTLVPVTEIVGYERLNAPSVMYVKYSTAPGETTLGWVGSSTILEWYAQSYPSAGKVNGVETLKALRFQDQLFQLQLEYWRTSTQREQTTLGGPGRPQDAVVLEDAFIRAVRNRGETVSVSNIRPYPSGSAVGITVRCGSGDASPARTMFEIPIYVTNGWTVVTNSMSVVTNGFDHVTNAAPPVVTSLVTERSLTNSLDKFSRIDVRRGEVRPVFTNSSAGVIFDVSVDSEALAPSVGVRSPAAIRIPGLQSVVVGGSTNASGRYVGGKTLYSEIGDVAGDEIRRSVSVEAVEPGTPYSRKLATISVPSGETDLYVPEFGKAGSPLKFIGDDLGVYVADLTNTMWDAYSSCNGSGMRRIGRFYLTSVTQPSGIAAGKITWTLDMSTWDGEIAVFPFRRARDQDGRVVWDSPVEADRILDSEHPLQIWFLFGGMSTSVWWYLVSGIVNPSVTVADEMLVMAWDSALPELSWESFFLSKDYPAVGGRVELRRVFSDGSYVRSHGLVPDSRKINGQQLTSDITIEGMPTTGLVWNATSGKVRTVGGRDIGAADIGAIPYLYDDYNVCARWGGEGFFSLGVIDSGVFEERVGIDAMNGVMTFWNPFGVFTRYDFIGVQIGEDMIGFPQGVSGIFAVENWQSLANMLDESTNATARTSVGAKMMTLIDQPVEQKINQSVSSHLNTYVDEETGVEYEGKWYAGSMYFVPTGNVYPPNN